MCQQMRFVISRSSVRIRRVAPKKSTKSSAFTARITAGDSLTGRIVRDVSAFVKERGRLLARAVRFSSEPKKLARHV
jgi:hypothetical protein